MALNPTTLSTALQSEVEFLTGNSDLSPEFFNALAKAVVEHIVDNNELSISFTVPTGGGSFSTEGEGIPVIADFQ